MSNPVDAPEAKAPDSDPGGGRLLGNLILFGRICRGLGLPAPPSRLIECARALTWINPCRKQDFYSVLKALLVTEKSAQAPFNLAFQLFWRVRSKNWSRHDLRALGEREKKRFQPDAARPSSHPQAGNRDRIQEVPVPIYGLSESLRRKDFAEMSGDELAQARQMIPLLGSFLSARRSRRLVAGKGPRIDARRMLRDNIRHLGEPVFIPTRRFKYKPRRLVLLCDISGSMEGYTRFLLHFMHTLSGSVRETECFVFATRLTRITRNLGRKSVDLALREVGSEVEDWGGGTRIGSALQRFNYRWSRRVLGWGSVVLLISDGWDRGDGDLLRKEALRLQRSCFKFLWLNPLLGRPGYQPLTGGAQALLPSVDRFLPVHNLASLEDLGRVLARLQEGRSFGVPRETSSGDSDP